MNRLVYALPIFAAALFPLPAAAAPSPSPAIEQTLAAPPSGYTAIHTGTLDGRFDPHALGATYSAGAAEAENTVVHDGFVDGYAMTWHQQSPPRDLIEYVVAFEGGRGASSWLSYDEAIAKSDPKFQHSESITGIEPSYGAHLSDPASGAVADVFSFVKGNDVYGVALISTADDVLNLAISQTKSQYGFAPSETIPCEQWPENVSASPAAPELFGGLAGQAVAIAAVLGVALVAVGLAMRARSTKPVAVVPAMAPVLPPDPAFQLSPDGNFWWNGQAWMDVEHNVPPTAQRSPDGRYWWDGRTWRSVARPSRRPL